MNLDYFLPCNNFQAHIFGKVLLLFFNLYTILYNKLANLNRHILLHNILNYISYYYYIYLKALDLMNKKLVDLYNHQDLLKFKILDLKLSNYFELINLCWNHQQFKLVVLYSLTSYFLID